LYTNPYCFLWSLYSLFCTLIGSIWEILDSPFFMRADYNSTDGEDLVPDDGRDDWPEPPSYRGLKLTLACILVVAVVTGVFLSWDYLVPKDHRARAMEFLAQENYASSVTELKHAIRDNPGDGELRWIMGDTYLRLKQDADATEYMQKAFDLGYRSPDLNLALARSKLQVRDYQGVLKLYQEWSDVDSDIGAAAWEVLRGWSLLNVGTQEEAVAAFQQALRLNPHNGEAKKGLVESGLGANLSGLSEEEIQRALSTGLDQPETWILRGELELSRDNMKDARVAYEGAVELGPDNMYALAGLVRTLIASNRLDDAREPAALLAKNFPADPMSAYVRALYAKQVEEYVQALDALKVVLDYEPDHAMSIFLMGEVYAAMGNPDLALEKFTLFHRLKPDSVLGRRRLAAMLNEGGSPKQAIELLEPLLEQSSVDPEIAAVLASAYTALGDKQRAKGYQSLFFSLGSVTTATRVALKDLNSGDTRQGISKLELLLEHAPEKPETRIMLAVSLLSAGEYDKALAISTDLVAERPEDAQVQYLHGSVLELSGDPITAVQFYESALTLDPTFSMADLALARIEMRSGNREAGRKRIEALLAKGSNNTTGELWLTQMAMRDGNSRDAIARLEKIRSADKKALQPPLILADYYLRQRNADGALRASQEIARMVPDHPVGMHLLANAQLLAGNIDEGLAILEQLEDANPDNLQLKWQILDALEAKGNSEAVYEALQRILAVDQNSSRALVKLAMMERLRGNQDAAMDLADQYTESHSESGMGYLIKGQILMDAQDYRPASDMLGKAYAMDADSITLSRYYTALARAGEFEKAEKAMSDWLIANPNDNIARLAWADELARAGNSARATELYEQAARGEPENVPVLVRLASGYHAMGDRRALKTALKAYELDSEDLYAKHLYGWLLVETGLADRGTQLLQEVVARAPQNVAFRVHLATALADSGLEDEARVALKPLLDAGVQLADVPEASALLQRLSASQ
jgi:putative PEP-CTERM system TPR-repeat lipoprotein